MEVVIYPITYSFKIQLDQKVPQKLFQIGPDFLNRVEVGGIRRKKDNLAPSFFRHPFQNLFTVKRRIVHDNHAACADDFQ